jgi:hypothetical protein
MIQSSIFDNGMFQVLTILAIFTGVGFIAYVIRKYFYRLPWEDKKVDPNIALKEEIERVLVPIEEPLVEKDKAVIASTPKPVKAAVAPEKDVSSKPTKKR